MGEVAIKGQRFGDAELLHHQEAQTVRRAVFLVVAFPEDLKGLSLLFKACAMDTALFSLKR